MRKTFFKGLDDALEYNFGSDVNIVCAGMEIARKVGPVKEECDTITSVCILTGEQLVGFIRENAKEHLGIIPQIKAENRYKLFAWDW